ncbi:MAG: YihA family ribosome biogenesis GTP-binding protein [Candidatus Eisenbacteria bacterium]|nr:YihA family ribosome biogenesis GTP-binding protein [Candidatus Eisenbacteria bacterium]
MAIGKIEFLLGAASLRQLPGGELPEIALAGRSNVGKSSLLNRIANRKKLARTSRTPGKTRELNLYVVDRKLILVDLPGYGFAKVSKKEKAKWGRLIESYLHEREELAGIVHLVDARHRPTADDIQMHEWIKHFRVPALIAATKADKISKDKRRRSVRTIEQVLEPDSETPIVLFSAQTGEGSKEIIGWILGIAGRQGGR